MEMPEPLPSSVWAEAWCKLYQVYSERLDQANVDLMDSILDAVVADAQEETSGRGA
jgi:hypothetical protein